MADAYTYERTTRSPVYLAAGGFCVLLLVLAISLGAPWWIWAVWAPVSAVVFYLLWANKSYGIRLTDTELAIETDGASQRFALSAIDHLHVRDWSDSTDFELHLKDGTEVSVFSENMPGIQAIRTEFEKRGVRVEVS
ncbi:MAG: hypothetical protein AAFR13_07515 [Pseudomonadota bacterium]